MAAEDRRTPAPRSRVGYAVVLLGAALFVATCFLPYYGFPGGRSVSLYDQLLVAQDGGLEFGAILFLFGGVAIVLVVAIVGLTRSERPSGRAFLAGAVAAWSLTWIGSLLQSARLREGTTIPGGLSLEAGFWLQAVSIGVAVIGTILVAARRMGAHERGAPNDALPTLPVGEIVDLVDEDDYVIGRAPRREVRARNLLHREVAAIVRNPVGEIYVHRRTDTKDVFPGMYDMFVAGVVTSGESYDDAIRRELSEELGIEGAEPAFLIKSRYRDSEINWWTCCYEVMWDGPIVHQEEEIAWGRFMPEDELIASLDKFPFVPDGLVIFRRYLDERAR